jgi:hypothetical protein
VLPPMKMTNVDNIIPSGITVSRSLLLTRIVNVGHEYSCKISNAIANPIDFKKRTGRDSNPRYAEAYTSFRD